MADWDRLTTELREAGDSGFEFDSGGTAVPGLSGEWVVGRIPREGALKRENQSILLRVCDALSLGGGAVSADPEDAPEPVRHIADRHGLDVVIVDVSRKSVRVALCDPETEEG